MREDPVNPPTTIYGALAGAFDEKHQGLLCRADPQCRSAFYVRATELCTKAAAARDAHELEVHAYTHVPLETTGFSFGTLMTRRGRSRL